MFLTSFDKKPVLFDGLLLTIQQIESACKQNNRILLIKAFRAITGMGLKDAKDTIDACSDTVSNPVWPGHHIFQANTPKVLQLFSKYLINPEQAAKLQKTQMLSKIMGQAFLNSVKKP